MECINSAFDSGQIFLYRLHSFVNWKKASIYIKNKQKFCKYR